MMCVYMILWHLNDVCLQLVNRAQVIAMEGVVSDHGNILSNLTSLFYRCSHRSGGCHSDYTPYCDCYCDWNIVLL